MTILMMMIRTPRLQAVHSFGRTGSVGQEQLGFLGVVEQLMVVVLQQIGSPLVVAGMRRAQHGGVQSNGSAVVGAVATFRERTVRVVLLVVLAESKVTGNRGLE